MIAALRCSWCHQVDQRNAKTWPQCANCGHRVDRFLILCDCPYCRSCTLGNVRVVIPKGEALRATYSR